MPGSKATACAEQDTGARGAMHGCACTKGESMGPPRKKALLTQKALSTPKRSAAALTSSLSARQLCGPASGNHLKKARCLLGMWGVRVGTTLAAPESAGFAPAAASAAWRSSLSFLSHASTTCSSFLPGSFSSGSSERGPPAPSNAGARTLLKRPPRPGGCGRQSLLPSSVWRRQQGRVDCCGSLRRLAGRLQWSHL